MKALLAASALAVVAGCGDGGGVARKDAAPRAERICEDAAVPGIPAGGGTGPSVRTFALGPRRVARMAELAARQERRELASLRGLRWGELEPALAPFEQSLVHLDSFVRSGGAAARERETYDRLLARWQSRAGELGLSVCSRFGFSF